MDQPSNQQEEPPEVRFYKANQARFRDTDVFLASVPRSGNTWMRLLLSDAILQHLGHETGTGGNIIPDVYKDQVDVWDQDPRLDSLNFRLIKTHQPFDESFGRVIYIFRHPAECFCSLYHYQFRYPGFKELNMTMDTFFDQCVDTWLENMRSYIEAAKNNPGRILFLSYEMIHEDTVGQLMQAMRFLAIEPSKETCQAAVAHQAFDRVQSAAKAGDVKKLGFVEDGGVKDFFRQGKVNSAAEEASPQALAILGKKTENVLNEANLLLTNLKSRL